MGKFSTRHSKSRKWKNNSSRRKRNSNNNSKSRRNRISSNMYSKNNPKNNNNYSRKYRNEYRRHTKINVTTTPTEGLIEDLEYTSGSPGIATVGADGNVKGIAEGTAVITIRGKNSGVSTTCTIKSNTKSNKNNKNHSK